MLLYIFTEMPCKHVPVLYIDGEPLTQSRAIARYVAREVGKIPSQFALGTVRHLRGEPRSGG